MGTGGRKAVLSARVATFTGQKRTKDIPWVGEDVVEGIIKESRKRAVTKHRENAGSPENGNQFQ